MSQRLTHLDALRAVAALSVVLQHAFERLYWDYGLTIGYTGFNPGYFGVTLFFLISGFVIAASLERTPLGTFWFKRLFRLFPAYWVSVALAAWYAPEPLSAVRLAANAAMIGGLAGQKLLLPIYWTLELELFLYGILTLLVLTRLRERTDALLLVVLCGAVVTDGVLPLLGVDPPRNVTSNWMLSNLGVLLLGVLSHRIWRGQPPQQTVLPAAGALLMLVTLLSALGGYPAWMVARTAGVTVFVAALAWRWSPPQWLVAVGEASYSLYLFHMFVIYAFAVPHPALAVACWVLASVTVALVAYHVVERPPMALAGRIIARRGAPLRGEPTAGKTRYGAS
ncbi:MAG: hypothetical protein RLZZ387_4244 [Chloroflexota bacterium]|jgi:peptidoglycan/LPS O-acetylase OafA/YrhL